MGSPAWVRIIASIALAVLVGVVVWLIVKDNREAGKLDRPSATSSAATLDTVRTLPGELGHDVYWAGPTYVANTHRFSSGPGSLVEVVRGFGPAFIYAAISAFIGLSRGRWMTKVQR